MMKIVILAVMVVAAMGAVNFRGISPDKLGLYGEDHFTCPSEGKKIPISQVNDDYCDCADGSDEPGTAACSVVDQETKAFYCANPGHTPSFLYRSQVDDGLCDCCDGSDEGAGVCENTCGVMAEKHAAEARIREEKRQGGLKKKEEMAGRAAALRASKEEELGKLRTESFSFDADIQTLDEKKRAEEATEAQEREVIKQESLKKRAEWELQAEERRMKREAEAAARPPPPAPLACVSWRQTAGCKADGDREPQADKDCESLIDLTQSGYCECENDKRFSFDCEHEDFNCTAVCAHHGIPEKPQVEEEFKVDEGLGHERPEAKTARDQHQQKTNEKMDRERRIGEIEAELREDNGPDNVFMVMRNECYSKDAGEYTYTLCIHKDVVQRHKSNGGQSTLGRWKGFAEQTYSSWGGGKDFTKMLFENGDSCWNGPVRTTTVFNVCGPDNEFLEVNEPSMCTYTITFQTPAVCE